MITFFMNPDITASNKILEIIYIVMGLICIYAAVKNALDKENPSRVGTAVFWGALGVVMAIGRWLPPMVGGAIIIIMALPAVLKKVKIGKTNAPTEKETAKQSEKIGMKIFIPAFSMGVFAILFALFTKLGALVGIGFGVLVSVIVLMVFDSKENKPTTFLVDSERFLGIVGPLCMLPMLLASLGAIFTAAGVGDVVAGLVGNIVPQGNINVGIIVYAIGMMLFTIIMGNAFAAITVMTAGIGYPFVMAYGVNPVLIGMLALTCGYCGTLMTPMAANFNIVPVAMLGIKDKYGVIKNQIFVALPLLVFQIIYMILFK